MEFRFMQIQHIMSTRVVTVELDDRLEVIKKIFDASKFHHVLVVEESRLFGVVSDRDLFKALSPYIDSTTETARDVATLNKRVHQVMSRKPITLRPEAPISEAIELFLDHQISCLPVVDKDFKPVGILSWRDILKWIKATQMPPATSA
ncbi:CBS domain-containing protein [Roseateles oligotrophus]|nr:CBS domain-containing protein [Roseateles oligotrophus]